jgi:hypothetical protein
MTISSGLGGGNAEVVEEEEERRSVDGRQPICKQWNNDRLEVRRKREPCLGS